MLNCLHAFRNVWALARDPRALLLFAKGNLELWANLFVITWAIAFMLWQGFGFAVSIGTVFAIWAILAVSLNLVLGFTGLLSVGHIGFFGIGAYATAILTSTTAYEQLRTEAIPTFGLPFFAALPVSVALAGLVALAVGVVFNRFRDDIFVLVSFGFAIISFNVFLNWRGLTRGAFGIHDIPRPEIAGWVFNGELEFLVLTLVFLVLVMAVAWFIVTSSFGRVLTAIREDEQAIEVFGYRATHYKLAIWVISAMMAGLAGSLFSSWTSFIDPFSFILLESILLVAIVILGGLATIWGSLLGAMAFVLLEEGMRFLPLVPAEYTGQARQIVLGILLVLLMLFRPQGPGREVQAMISPHKDTAGGFALETDKISKHFGAVRAVDQLSLSIPREGVTSIVGPNGSGKSTLVNLLSGTLPLDGGMVIIDGVGLKIVKAYETPGHGLTRTFQEVRLFDQISVLDNIMVVLTERRLFPALMQRTRSSHREKAQRVLETVGMWEKRDSLAMNLSYGQRKLLEIGRALALDVNTYLLDEPYAGLFPQMVERVKDIMKAMRADGRTIIFISHNMDIVRELSDRIIVLEGGSLLAQGDVEEVLSSEEVIDAYLGV